MSCFSKTYGKETLNVKREYKRIKYLYVALENLSSLADEDEKFENKLTEIENKFEHFFQKRAEGNYKRLFHNDILHGTIAEDLLRDDPLQTELEENEINENTLLFRAMSMSVEKESRQENVLENIKTILIESCPKMMFFPIKKNEKFKGMTPLHVAILKEDTDFLDQMAKVAKKENIKPKTIKDVCADGFAFQNTVMMAGTPLGVAALKFNKDLFCMILKQFESELDVTNHKGDNIVHSLIKYAHVQPDKMEEVLDMLRYVLNCECLGENDSKNKRKKKVSKLLMMKNKEQLNPLQLAAKRQQFAIFQLIMHDEVYCTKESNNGIFNEEVFDITEIETLALENGVKGDEHENIKKDSHESIMEYFIHQQTTSAFLFADFMPVREVIIEKWKHYSRRFHIWFSFHFLFMVLLSVSALYRSKLEPSENMVTIYEYPVSAAEAFVTTVSVIGCLVGVLYIVLEISRVYLCRFQFKTSTAKFKSIRRHFSAPYSNLVFRIYFALFSLLLVSDFIFASVAGQNSNFNYQNYCLLFAVLLGWYLFMFFLQTFKTFSFFTVLIQRVILDMFKFAFVMGIFLVAFSIAMYMAMQGANTDNDDFENFGKTTMKMFTIMLGIGEIDILFQARQPILAITVFVLFVLLTTILLLNALIAMMSNSCTDLMTNQRGTTATKMHCRLQKLSVILYLESFLPRFMCKEVGSIKRKLRYENNEWDSKIKRRFWSLSSIHEHKEEIEIYDPSDQGIVNTLMSHLRPHKNTTKKTHAKDNEIHPTVSYMTDSDMQTRKHLRRTLNIQDIGQKPCDACKNNTYSNFQTETQEIVEVIEVPN